MPPAEAVIAVLTGVGLAAALVGSVALAAALGERRADRLFPGVLRDYEAMRRAAGRAGGPTDGPGDGSAG